MPATVMLLSPKPKEADTHGAGRRQNAIALLHCRPQDRHMSAFVQLAFEEDALVRVQHECSLSKFDTQGRWGLRGCRLQLPTFCLRGY